MENLYQFARISTYLLCINMQLFTFSFFGSKLLSHSAKIAETVYEIRWYNKPIPLQKYISLIMIRAQRPMGISAAKFYFISLQSFAKVCVAFTFRFMLIKVFLIGFKLIDVLLRTSTNSHGIRQQFIQ